MSDNNENRPVDDDVLDEPIDDSIEIEALPETEENAHPVPKKLIVAVATVLALLLALGLATYAISTLSVDVPNNYFETGSIDLNLNGGAPVIEQSEFRFEPGMTVRKDFFIENPSATSSGDVYYKLYLKDVEGELADVLILTVADGSDVLYTGTATNFTEANAKTADRLLSVGEKRTLTITFYYPREAGNDTQNDDLSFVLWAKAVQTKNNPGKAFN